MTGENTNLDYMFTQANSNLPWAPSQKKFKIRITSKSTGKKFDIKIILKSPSTYAVVIAVAFLYFDLEMPKFVLNTVMLLGYAMIVLILM